MKCQLIPFLWSSNIWPVMDIKYPNNKDLLIFSPLFPASCFQNPRFFFSFTLSKNTWKNSFQKSFPIPSKWFPDYKRNPYNYKLKSPLAQNWRGVAGMERICYQWDSLQETYAGLGTPQAQRTSSWAGHLPEAGDWEWVAGTLACRLAPAARGCRGRSWISVCCLAKFTNT